MKIYFEIEVAENIYMNFEDLMDKVNYDEQFRLKLLTPKYLSSTGIFGKVTIQFYDHIFTIKDEFVTSILFRFYINAAIKILKNETYQNTLEDAYTDTIVFDYIDCNEIGVRIRQYTHKKYYNNMEECVFRSMTNYMIQEIIVPKKEFIEQTILCSEQYFTYSDKLKFPNPHPHYEYWRTSLKELKEQFYNYNFNL